jgi:site-specific DNA-cytosine methylase
MTFQQPTTILGAIDGDVTHTLRLGNGGTQSVPSVAGDSAQVGVLYSIMPMNSGTDYKAREVEVSQPLMTAPTGGNQGGDYIVQPLAIRGREGGAELELGGADDPAFAVRATKVSTVAMSFAENQQGEVKIVRRLTEMECERLQGFPDGWTDGQTASARYRQLGNSVAVPCVEWIARRLIAADEASL